MQLYTSATDQRLRPTLAQTTTSSTADWRLQAMAVPIPSNNFHNTTIAHGAITRCLDLERRHEQVPQEGRLSVLVCARFLGYLLLEAPTDAGRDGIASKIMRCADDASIQGLGEIYKDHFIRCFYPSEGSPSTPSDSLPMSLSNVNPEDGDVASLLALRASHAKVGQMALKRDRYRCCLTGWLHEPAIKHGIVTYVKGKEPTDVYAVHIIGGTSKLTKTYSSEVIFGEYGGLDTADLLDEDPTHILRNIVSVGSELFGAFRRLEIWLERDPADPPNVYKPAAMDPHYLWSVHPQITFATPDPTNLPVPDPRYLAVHAACARALHLSGAKDYIREVLYDMEDTGVLPPEGSSDVLYLALVRRLDIESH